MSDLSELDTDQQWDLDAMVGEAYARGRADMTPYGHGPLMIENGWPQRFGEFYAGREQDISGTGRDRTMGEWWEFWRMCEESTEPER